MMEERKTHGAPTLYERNTTPSITDSAIAPVRTLREAECNSSVSTSSVRREKERAEHVDMHQLEMASSWVSSKKISLPLHSLPCSAHPTPGGNDILQEGPTDSLSWLQQIIVPDYTLRADQHTLDADQYTLYAAYYQWYYSGMRRAKQRVADARAQNTEKCCVDTPLLNSKRNLVLEWLKRPARQQVDEKELRRYSHKEGGTEYNIWYGKYLTDRYTNTGYNDRETAAYKCSPERDAGYTVADTNTPSTDMYFCIYFAKGACVLGKECRYRHSIPTLDDEAHLEWSHDIFGRERFKCHRDDMDGVGSFTNDCKTLFVCGFRVEPAEPDALRHTEELLRKEFAVWGDLEDVRVIPKKHIAFISYAYRVQAEFAKAAMANQNLGSRAPLLVVKWAFENPRVERKRKCPDRDNQLYVVQQAAPTHVERGKSACAPDEDLDSVVAEAAQFRKLVECKRSCSAEAVDMLASLLQMQCEKWEHQLKRAHEIRDESMKSFSGANCTGQIQSEWTAAQTCSNVADRPQDRAAHDSCSEDIYSLAAHPFRGANQLLSQPPGTSEASFPEEICERQASVTAACKRIQEVLSRVESLEPAAFEVHV